MTIADAFNDIAVKQGGQADKSGTIAGAVDALTDALAGSDVAQGATIEDGVRVLGEYISGGGGGGSFGALNYCINKVGNEYSVCAYVTPTNDGYIFTAKLANEQIPIPANAYIGVPSRFNLTFALYDDDNETIGDALTKVATVDFEGDNTDLYKVPEPEGSVIICLTQKQPA